MTGAVQGTWIRRLWPAAAYQCAFIAAITLLKAAANAVVVARFQPQALPYLYVAAAALTAAVTTMAAMTSSRRTGREPIRLAWIGAGVSLAVTLALVMGLSSSALLLYLFAETFTTFTSIMFWSAMSDAFDAREARRAFSALAGVGMSGSIVGGVAAQALARGVGTVGLVVGGGVLCAVAAFFFRFHAANEVYAAPKPTRHVPRDDVWAFLRSHPYPFGLALLILALAVITPFADFVFRQRASRTLGEDELAALFGNVQLWLGLFCVVFQLLIAERLLRRLGILRYLALIPLALAPFSLAALASDALWPAYLLKLVESAISLSIVPVALQLLYVPFPDGVRDRVRALMDGVVKKGGLALGGLLLIGAGSFVTGPIPVIVLVLLSAAAGVVLWRLRPAYVSALQARVGDPGEAEEVHLDSSDQAFLVETLGASEPDRVLHALRLLEEGGADLRPYVPGLIAHSTERVVERGVQLALALGVNAATPRIEELLASDLRRPRIEAVWALAKLAPARAAEVLPALRQHPDPGVRCAALGALLETGAAAEAEATLRDWLDRRLTSPVAERRELARLLGRLRDERWIPALRKSLKDGDGSVRNLAIQAVGEGGYGALAPMLLPFLTWRDERRAARDALSALGDEIVPLLEEVLNDRTRPAGLRYKLPRVLRQIGTQQAFDVLLYSNVKDDAFLHYRIGVALSWLKEERPEIEADVQRVREAIVRRREVYREMVGPWRDLRVALGDGSLLTRAVGDRLDQAFEISFWLLGLLYPSRTMRRIHEHLVGTDARRRAYALELLDNLVEEEDRELVALQIHAHHRDLPPGAAGRLTEHLETLCSSDDNVLRACAQHLARAQGQWSLPPSENDMSDATLKRMFALERVEIFAQSDVDDIAAVAAVAREVRFRAGERIYEEGDPGDALYVIVNGTVDAFRRGDRVLTLKDREQFGDVSLLDGSPRPTLMIARADTTCLVIDRRDFLDLIADRPELLKGIFRAVSRQLREVVDLAARRNTGEIQAPPRSRIA